MKNVLYCSFGATKIIKLSSTEVIGTSLELQLVAETYALSNNIPDIKNLQLCSKLVFATRSVHRLNERLCI